MKDITGIIVSYNTCDLLRNCIESIREFHPELKLIIVDGSESGSECFNYSKSLNNGVTKCINVEYNIGHGNGMKLGISVCNTRYFVLIDSDTIMTRTPLYLMKEKIGSYYGIGKVVEVDGRGDNVESGIRYLHPYFTLINKEEYLKYSPIIHHGAPMLNAMIDLKNKDVLIKEFDLENYIIHLGRGTRVTDPVDFHPKTWVKVTN